MKTKMSQVKNKQGIAQNFYEVCLPRICAKSGSLLSLAFFALLVFACGNGEKTAGNTTTTTNGISARVFNEGVPVADAQIRVRSTDHSAILEGEVYQLQSDDEGSFLLEFPESLDSFSIEIFSGDSSLGFWAGDADELCQNKLNNANLCVLDSIELVNTLAVSGVIQVADTVALQNLQVGLAGSDFIADVDSAGNYSFDNLPPGDYQLQVWEKSESQMETADLLGEVVVEVEADNDGNLGIQRIQQEGILALPIPANLVGWWALEDTAGGILSDWSGRNNDGGIWREPEIVEGVMGNALYTTSASNFLNLSNDNRTDFHFGPAQDFTIALFFKTSVADADTMTLINKEGAGLSRIQLQILPNGHLEFLAREFNQVDFGDVMEVDVRDDEWHHVAFGRSDSELFLYFDAIEQFSNYVYYVEAFNLVDGALRAGANRTTDQRFVGAMDEIMVFRKALGAVELNKMYNAFLVD